MVGGGLPHIILCKMFLWSLQKMRDFMFHNNKPISFHYLPYNLHVLTQHCFISWWCWHIGRYCHRRLYLSWFDFTGCSFWWGCDDNCDLGERWSLSWSIPNGHVSLSNCGSFWMFTLIGGWIFSSMCQHGVGSKRHSRNSSFNFMHIL